MTTILNKIIYTKNFWLKEDAKKFIESHKKQDCFELEFKNLHWKVTKVKPLKVIY